MILSFGLNSYILFILFVKLSFENENFSIENIEWKFGKMSIQSLSVFQELRKTLPHHYLEVAAVPRVLVAAVVFKIGISRSISISPDPGVQFHRPGPFRVMLHIIICSEAFRTREGEIGRNQSIPQCTTQHLPDHHREHRRTRATWDYTWVSIDRISLRCPSLGMRNCRLLDQSGRNRLPLNKMPSV